MARPRGYQRHPQPLAVLPDPSQPPDLGVLARRADVERVADRVRSQPDRVLHAGRERRHRIVVVGDVRLAVELQKKRDAPGVVAHVLLGQADPEGHGGILSFESQAEHEVGVEGLGVGEEVGRPVLQPLVQRQHQ
jgi:hypothetical protein